MLQKSARLPPGWSLVYYAFDLLHLNGTDLTGRPLRERRALLEKTLGDSGVLLSQSLPGTMPQIIQAVKAHGFEGIIAKRLDSKYQFDRRSNDWLKLPLKPFQDFVIGRVPLGRQKTRDPSGRPLRSLQTPFRRQSPPRAKSGQPPLPAQSAGTACRR